MELIDLLRVIRRWFWLIVVIAFVPQLALWLGTRSAEPVYAATATLQISTPQREEVEAYDEYRAISLRDEITVAINNFLELLQSDEVRQRVVSQLSLNKDDSNYTISASQVQDADFVNVRVEARTPSLAAEIADAHVALAITYYGELRSRTTNAEKNLFATQLRVAEQEYNDAEKALADFRTEHGIFSLNEQISTQQQLLEQLQLERDQRLLDQAAIAMDVTVVPTSKTTVLSTPTYIPMIDLVGEIDKLIAQRQAELYQFTALAPQYNLLEENVEQARAAYKHLLSKYTEAQLKVIAVQAANFIQVIKPAYSSNEAESSWLKLAVLALAGSLGLGLMLAFFFDYISKVRVSSTITPVSEPSKKPGRKRASRKASSINIEQDTITGQD